MKWFVSLAQVKDIIRRFWKEIVLFASIFFVFYVNASYVSYPDEFVNLMGGSFILQGKLPYKEFFDHHMPLAWYLGALLLTFSLKSYVVFRLLWGIFVFGIFAVLALWIRRRAKELYPYFLGFFALYPLMAVYFWFHLYLADSLAVLFFTVTFWILLVETLSPKARFGAIIIASLSTFLLVFSSMTFVYLAMVLYLWQLYLVGWRVKRVGIFIFLSLLPYALYFLYLVLTGSWKDFYAYNVTYNINQYISIPNYTKGRYFNPIKFAYTLIYNFYSGYIPVLSTIKDLDLYLPVSRVALLGSLFLFILLLLRNGVIGIIFLLALSFSAPRSSLQMVKETDYQISLFLVFGVISAFVSLYMYRKSKNAGYIMRDAARIVHVLLVIFIFFSFIFLIQNTYNKYYLRYTQKMPSITDISYTADFVDRVLGAGDYYWVGPFEPHEVFFVKKARLPGKFIHLLPQFSENEQLKRSFLEQFKKHPPKIIIYKQAASIFQTPALQFGAFFIEWMKNKYTLIEDIEGISVKKSPSSFTLVSDLYVRNEDMEALLDKLQQTGFILIKQRGVVK